MKFLFVSPEALTLDLAYTILQEGNEVKFCVQSMTEKDVGDGFVDKVDEWESHVDWADVIVFDDIGFGRTADKLRSEGKKVVGGSSYTDRLENEREFGQQELEKVGVSVLPSWNFSDFEEAVKFVQVNPGRYVIKPSGKAQNEKELLFVGQEADGNDVINVLARYKKRWSNKIRIFQLQKFSSGVEVAVGAFFNGREFVHPINTNFEHKRLFPDNIGPSTGEMGCYDDKTEVLTDKGWKFFKDVSYDDEICTLDPSTHVIEYHKPIAIVVFDHHDKLVTLQNSALDIAVTLDHNMYVCSQQSGKHGANKFDFVRARNLGGQSVIKRTGMWIGTDQEYFTLPSVSVRHQEGNQATLHCVSEMRIPMDDWLAFMGVWSWAGSAFGNKISVTHRTTEKSAIIEKMLSKLPFSFTKDESGFYCYDKQLYSYLKNLGPDWYKHVPDFVKDLSPRQITLFLDWYALDSRVAIRNGSRVFCTPSKRLADDIQELLLKIGRLGIVDVKQRDNLPWTIHSLENPSRTEYEIIEQTVQLDSYIERKDARIISYSGRVYCASVKNHIMYVRRNGKPCWCGNTLMWWSERNKIFEHTLEKIKPRLAESGYVGYIDINCIANGTGIYPLEFTSRFGYPTISIQMEGVTNKWGQFLYSLASGQNVQLETKRGFQIGVVVAVPPFPFNDEKTFRKFSEEATILFNKPDLAGVHLGEVKREGNDWHIAGKSGYSLVVTGSGDTTEEARALAYKRVANIMIPNMFYRTDIGSRWVRDSDLLLSFGYMK